MDSRFLLPALTRRRFTSPPRVSITSCFAQHAGLRWIYDDVEWAKHAVCKCRGQRCRLAVQAAGADAVMGLRRQFWECGTTWQEARAGLAARLRAAAKTVDGRKIIELSIGGAKVGVRGSNVHHTGMLPNVCIVPWWCVPCTYSG